VAADLHFRCSYAATTGGPIRLVRSIRQPTRAGASVPLRRFEDAHEVGSQGDHLVVAVEADVQQVGVPADDLALLVQPTGECPVGRVDRDLLNPALQGNVGALGVAKGNVTEGNAGALGVARGAGGGW
jgi:hypothetical protein